MIKGNGFLVHRAGGHALGEPLLAVALDHHLGDSIEVGAAQVNLA